MPVWHTHSTVTGSATALGLENKPGSVENSPVKPLLPRENRNLDEAALEAHYAKVMAEDQNEDEDEMDGFGVGVSVKPEPDVEDEMEDVANGVLAGAATITTAPDKAPPTDGPMISGMSHVRVQA